MAKSKRNKVVALTKTKKNQLTDKKSGYINKVQELADKYNYVLSFSFKNMSTFALQCLRQYFKDEES